MSFRVRLGFGFGIGNLIGGAVGTVGCCARKTPVLRAGYFRACKSADFIGNKHTNSQSLLCGPPP